MSTVLLLGVLPAAAIVAWIGFEIAVAVIDYGRDEESEPVAPAKPCGRIWQRCAEELAREAVSN